MNAIVDRERIARVLGMLGSDHDGEVLAAARQAERLRRAARLTWPELIAGTPTPDPASDSEPLDWRDAVTLCRAYPDRLTSWEAAFVENVAGYRSPPSARQQQILDRLVAKVRG